MNCNPVTAFIHSLIHSWNGLQDTCTKRKKNYSALQVFFFTASLKKMGLIEMHCVIKSIAPLGELSITDQTSHG
jgi:hypothetical protein